MKLTRKMKLITMIGLTSLVTVATVPFIVSCSSNEKVTSNYSPSENAKKFISKEDFDKMKKFFEESIKNPPVQPGTEFLKANASLSLKGDKFEIKTSAQYIQNGVRTFDELTQTINFIANNEGKYEVKLVGKTITDGVEEPFENIVFYTEQDLREFLQTLINPPAPTPPPAPTLN